MPFADVVKRVYMLHLYVHFQLNECHFHVTERCYKRTVAKKSHKVTRKWLNVLNSKSVESIEEEKIKCLIICS